MMLPSKVSINFTLKYLTLSVEYSLLPHNFIFKSPSSFFYLDLKIIISVFFTLSELLFAFNKLTRCFKSSLICLFSFLVELLRHNRLASSTKWWTLQNFIAWLWSFIYNKNRSDPTHGALPYSSYPCPYLNLGLDW